MCYYERKKERKREAYCTGQKGHGVLWDKQRTWCTAGQTKAWCTMGKTKTWCTAGQTKDMVYYETESTKVHYRAQARKEVYLYAHCENNLVV